MGRKNYSPGSDRRDKAIIPYELKDFSAGVVKGQAASKIPQNALADAYDVIVYPDEVTGREGNVEFGVEIPPLDDRTGYTASMSGDIITAPASTFVESDVSNYFVFPGSPDTHYELIEYISDTQIKAHTTGTHASTLDCYLRGKTNLMQWHKIVRKWVFIWGSDVYVANWDMQNLIRCRVISRDLPNNSVSGYDDLDEFAGLVFNSNGLFRIDLEREIPLVYKLNTPIPNIAIPDILETDFSKYNYHYLYSACRLFESGNLVNRLTPSRIEQETGSNIWDDTYRDYSDVFTDEPIGTQYYYHGILTCAELVDPNDMISTWKAISDGSFNIGFYPIDDRDFIVDFSNVESMEDVADVIELALKDYHSNATCEYKSRRFIINTGYLDEDDIEVSDMVPAASGTDISTIIGGTVASGAVINNDNYNFSSPTLGPLYIPNVPNTTPQEYQWHYTHFPIYRTKDLAGRYKINVDADQFNSPNDFIWVKDLRVCAAFFGEVTDGVFRATVGIFEDEDVGSTLELEDGSRYEITEVYSEIYAVIAYDDGYPYDFIVGTYVAAAIGNGRVFRAYQVGNLVTRTRGDTFTSNDVRKPMKWASGYYSYITEYIDANNVRVADDQDKSVMGMTMDPVYRHFYDTNTDDTLDSRLGRLKLKQRYWEAMPNGNVGKVVPGLIFTAARGKGEISYGQIPDTLEYLHGFHDKGYQITNKIPDDIQYMWLFQDLLVIWTSRKTWRWPTSGYQFITNDFTKDAILQITGLEISEEDRGCFNFGSIEAIGDGSVMLLTSEPGQIGWRRFNGYKYGPNELEIQSIGKERIPDIQKLQQATKTIYDGRSGLLLFGRE